jgi:nitronate monooxygenase
MKTRITDLLNIEYPIICGGLFRVGRAPLAAAVSEAGGLGIITSATFETAEELRQEIRLAKNPRQNPLQSTLICSQVYGKCRMKHISTY